LLTKFSAAAGECLPAPVAVGVSGVWFVVGAGVVSALEGEVGDSQCLDFLPGFWSGFGWDVNGTYIDGVFNNLSKWGINTAGIYEQGPYSFRLSYTWRSSYTVGTFTGGVQPQFEYASPRENLDFSFNYAVNDTLTVTLDGTNIINSFYKDHAGRGSANALLFNTNIAELTRHFRLVFAIGCRRYRVSDYLWLTSF